MLTLLPKDVLTKKLKFFCLKIFSICHRCQRHRWCTSSREYLREYSKKFEMAVMVHSGDWGKLIHEKNQKSKISWHCPFNDSKQTLFSFHCLIFSIHRISNLQNLTSYNCSIISKQRTNFVCAAIWIGIHFVHT